MLTWQSLRTNGGSLVGLRSGPRSAAFWGAALAPTALLSSTSSTGIARSRWGVQAGALDSVRFVLLCQGRGGALGIRDRSALQFRVPWVSGG
jgi:hypothetical protein